MKKPRSMIFTGRPNPHGSGKAKLSKRKYARPLPTQEAVDRHEQNYNWNEPVNLSGKLQTGLQGLRSLFRRGQHGQLGQQALGLIHTVLGGRVKDAPILADMLEDLGYPHHGEELRSLPREVLWRNVGPGVEPPVRRTSQSDAFGPDDPNLNRHYSRAGKKRKYNRMFGPPQDYDINPDESVNPEDTQNALWDHYPQAYRLLRRAVRLPGTSPEMKQQIKDTVNNPTSEALHALFAHLSKQGGVYGRVDWGELHKQLLDYSRIKHFRDSLPAEHIPNMRDMRLDTRTDHLYENKQEVPVRFGPPLDHDPDLMEMRHQMSRKGQKRKYHFSAAAPASVRGLIPLLNKISSPRYPAGIRRLALQALLGDIQSLKLLGPELVNIDVPEVQAIDWDRLVDTVNSSATSNPGQFADPLYSGSHQMPLHLPQQPALPPQIRMAKKGYGYDVSPGDLKLPANSLNREYEHGRRGSDAPALRHINNPRTSGTVLGASLRRLKIVGKNTPSLGNHGRKVRHMAHHALMGDLTAAMALEDYLTDHDLHPLVGLEPGVLPEQVRNTIRRGREASRHSDPQGGLSVVSMHADEVNQGGHPSLTRRVSPPRQQYAKGGGINAPAGGVVVRGQFYQGGKYIPKSEVERANYDQYMQVHRARMKKYQRPDGSMDPSGWMTTLKTGGTHG